MNSETVLVLLSAIGAASGMPLEEDIAAAAPAQEDALDVDAEIIMLQLQDSGMDANSTALRSTLFRHGEDVDELPLPIAV